MNESKITNSIDWTLVLLYSVLVAIGWFNLYSTSSVEFGVFDFNDIYGKQLMFIIATFFIIVVMLNVSARIYENYSLIFYIAGIIMLAGLFVFGSTVKGQTNWYQFGGFSFQPSEFVKFFTVLLIAKFISDGQINLKNFKNQIILFAIIGLPTVLILLQPDAGSAMVFVSLIFLLHRFGLPHWYLIVGFGAVFLFLLGLFFDPIYIILTIGLIMALIYYRTKKRDRQPLFFVVIFCGMALYTFSVDYIFDNVLEPHHRDRINVLFDDNVNPKKEGYNLNQSMIAIGSGGLFGKGYLQGTQTKGGFVPEQHTDYIFTTLAEEWGFVGSTVVILLFMFLILRIIKLTQRQRNYFTQIYGYGVACILTFHFLVNLAMLMKLFPTIGVPLPYFSKGGSSFIAFSVMLFIFIKLDANRAKDW